MDAEHKEVEPDGVSLYRSPNTQEGDYFEVNLHRTNIGLLRVSIDNEGTPDEPVVVVSWEGVPRYGGHNKTGFETWDSAVAWLVDQWEINNPSKSIKGD